MTTLSIRTLRLASFPLLFSALAFGCSSSPTVRKSDPGAPTILTTRSEPGTIELNRDLQPLKTPTIQADVHDYHSQVTEVTLEFANVPLTVPMRKVQGDTWEVQLDENALEMMAISGQTAKYGAKVVAKDADGKVGLSENEVEVAVKAPQLARASKT